VRTTRERRKRPWTQWRWAEKCGMQFNLEKCKIMHVGRNNPQYEYKMNGMVLSTTEEEKDVL
jgi:hypothetical protein